jgi:hypothetical protein
VTANLSTSALILRVNEIFTHGSPLSPHMSVVSFCFRESPGEA